MMMRFEPTPYGWFSLYLPKQWVLMTPTCSSSFILIIFSHFKDIYNLSLFFTYCGSGVREKFCNLKISFRHIIASAYSLRTCKPIFTIRSCFEIASFKNEKSLNIFESQEPRSADLQKSKILEINYNYSAKR